MENSIDSYKLNNAKLAISLSEKKSEIKSLNDTIVAKCQELQEVQHQNAAYKQELEKYKDKMKVLKVALLEMIQKNSQQYSKLLDLTGYQLTNIQAPKHVSNGGNSPAGQLYVPHIVITAPKPGVLQQQPQQKNGTQDMSPKRSMYTQSEIARTPRSPSPSPFGLSNITEENTMDITDENYMNISLSEAVITTAVTHVETLARNNVKNNEKAAAVSEINSIFIKDNKMSVEPLTSKENIPNSKKPAPKSVKTARRAQEEKRKETLEEKTPPPNAIQRRANTVTAPNKKQLSHDETHGRPKRKAAPVQLVEPKMNTKLRRN